MIYLLAAVALAAAVALGFTLGRAYGMRQLVAGVQLARKVGQQEGRDEMHAAFVELLDMLHHCDATGQPIPDTPEAMRAALAATKAPAAD